MDRFGSATRIIRVHGDTRPETAVTIRTGEPSNMSINKKNDTEDKNDEPRSKSAADVSPPDTPQTHVSYDRH